MGVGFEIFALITELKTKRRAAVVVLPTWKTEFSVSHLLLRYNREGGVALSAKDEVPQ